MKNHSFFFFLICKNQICKTIHFYVCNTFVRGSANMFPVLIESIYLLQKKVVLIVPGMSSKNYTSLAVIIELVETSKIL